MSLQNNFDNFDSFADWYPNAAGMEFRTTWGSLPLFKADVPHLEFIRVQTCWLDNTLDDMQARRRSVEALARSVLSPTDFPDQELKKWWSLFGVESISPKLADAICTLYNNPPYRKFSTNEGINTAFTEIYDSFGVNHTMKDAYRSSLFTNVVALMPDWETKQIKVLTPDYFRLVGNDELWIAHGNGGFKETEFEVWSAEEKKTVDYQGKLISKETNPYGRIPAVILKLNRSNDTYGSGISEAAELSTWSNFIRFISTRIGVFQSFSVGLGVNLDIKAGTRIGPGYFLSGTNKIGEAGANPTFEYKSPDGRFLELEEYRQSVIRSFERNQGLPGFLVDEGAGQPPTGAALQVMERSLNDKRREHSYALLQAEKDLVSLIALQAKLFANRDIIADTFSVQYANAETFNDPKAELEHDTLLKAMGLMSPSAMVLKYLNQRMSEEEAVLLMETNKKLFAPTVLTTPEIPV